ncbi:UNVERIFIED_CONTAM: hypothetical protein Sradi_7000400 [Sesamum radiatum]|uniref:Uncharacterized protein n=1 Tax=Sesamum radiatum TaxID=300843 RepID=A0AAW2JC37_SESRA
MLRSWVKDWLRYCRWYYMVALAPTVDLEDSFKVKTGPELVRFGILWKVFDMVANKGTDFSVPILEPLSELTRCASFPCLLGGAKGTDFVVLSLSQPKAGRGWVASLYTPNECRSSPEASPSFFLTESNDKWDGAATLQLELMYWSRGGSSDSSRSKTSN